jgi:tRNA G10  N-methylase Trm11
MLEQYLNKVHCMSSVDLMDALPDESIDVICTDPPYARASLPLYAAVLERAGRILKPEGHLLFIAPHYAVDEIGQMSHPGLRFRWTLAMIQRTGNWKRLCNARRNIAVTFKPLYWYTRDILGEPDYRGIIDSCDPLEEYGPVILDSFNNGQPDKKFHVWEQSMDWARYVLQFAPKEPGGTFLDPYVGTGVSTYVAAQHGMNWIAGDNDPAQCEIARARMSSFSSAEEM